MNTSFGLIQVRTLIDKFLEKHLKEGKLPDFKVIVDKINKMKIGDPITTPVAFRDRQVLSKSTIENLFSSIEMDIDVLYNALYEADRLGDIMESKVDIAFVELNRLITELEEETSDITDATVISNKFSSFADIDKTETTATLTLPEGAILPTTGMAIRRIPLNKIYKVNFPINILCDVKIKYNASDKYMPFYRPFWGEGAWRHEVITIDPADYITITFDIPLDKRQFINGIKFRSLTRSEIEILSTNDDYAVNLVRIPGTGVYDTYGSYVNISFPEVLCTMLRVRAKVYVADTEKNLHVLSFDDFGIYSTGYTQSAKVVTKWYNVSSDTSTIKIDVSSSIPTGTYIRNKIEFSDGVSSNFQSGESIPTGVVHNNEEIVSMTKTRTSFITENLHGLYNGISFYKIPLGEIGDADVVDIKRGYNSIKMRVYTTNRIVSVKNIFNTERQQSNIKSMYMPVEDVFTSGITATDTDLDINGNTHTNGFYIKLSKTLFKTDEMPLVSSNLYESMTFETIKEKTDNASIYYIKFISSTGTETIIPANAVIYSEDKTKIFIDRPIDSFSSIKIAYKTQQVSDIKQDTIIVVTETGVELKEGLDFTIDKKNKQIIFKRENIGIVYVTYEVAVGNISYTEFSTNFIAKTVIDTMLKTPLVFSNTDKLLIDGNEFSTQRFPLLQTGYHTFLLRTESTDPLAVLYQVLTITNTDNKLIFFDLLSIPQANLSSMKLVDLDYLLYNTYRLDGTTCAITSIGVDKYIIVPFIPYYEEGSNCTFPIIITDNTGTLLTSSQFKSAVTNSSERFRVWYNIVVSTTPERFRLLFTLERDSDIDVTPTLSGYEIQMR